MSDDAAALETLLVQPGVDQGEALAAVIVFAVLDAYRSPVLEDRDVLWPAIACAAQQLCQVNRGVIGMVDAEQQHLGVELVGATERAIQSMRHIDRMWS